MWQHSCQTIISLCFYLFIYNDSPPQALSSNRKIEGTAALNASLLQPSPRIAHSKSIQYFDSFLVNLVLDATSLYGELCAIVSPNHNLKNKSSWVTQAHSRLCGKMLNTDKKSETSHRILACLLNIYWDFWEGEKQENRFIWEINALWHIQTQSHLKQSKGI